MSQAALVIAVRDKLRTALNLTAAQCDVQIDGIPPPACGDLYVAVHPAGWRPELIECLDEWFDVDVTVTLRIPHQPQDRQGLNVWARALIGLEARLRAALVAIHGRPEVITAANQLIPGQVNTLIEVLRFRHVDPKPRKVGPDWFGASSSGRGSRDQGLVQTITFGDARRVQSLDLTES